MIFAVLALILGLIVGSWITTAVERLPFDDEFHYQLFSGEDTAEPLAWWMRIPFVWFFVTPPGGPLPHWYDRLPLLPHFIYSWKFANFRKMSAPAHCAGCKHRLRWTDRIPLISFLACGGRCRWCNIKIPGRLFFVELATGLLYAIFAARLGPTWWFLATAFLIPTFVVASVIDWRFQIIPDELNSMGVVGALVFVVATQIGVSTGLLTDDALLNYAGMDYPFRYESVTLPNALLGLLAGAGAFYLFAEFGGMLAGTDAMGGGDIKLAGYVGLILGWQGAGAMVFASAFVAVPFGILVMIKGKAKKDRGFTKFAFGPYICVAALLVLYHGHDQLLSSFINGEMRAIWWFNEQIVKLHSLLTGG